MNIVLVGAGLAAQRCAHALRRRGHDGPITIVGDEGRLPYDRPPLSKERLAGECDDDALALRPAAWYAEHGIELRLGDPAVALDPVARTVTTASGAALSYDRVLVATGARPLQLPGMRVPAQRPRRRRARRACCGPARGSPSPAPASSARRSRRRRAGSASSDADRDRADAAPRPARSRARRVVRPAARARRASTSGSARRSRTSRRARSRWTTARGSRATPPGRRRRARPTRLARGAGLPAHGLPVDARGATGVPGVFAAGDVALGHHWEAAVAQGVAAAHGMLGLDPPPHPRPSFWSDQYGIRIQFAGDPRGADAVELDGDPDARDFTAFYLRDGVVRAGLLVGRPRALPALRDQLDQPLSEPQRRAA